MKYLKSNRHNGGSLTYGELYLFLFFVTFKYANVKVSMYWYYEYIIQWIDNNEKEPMRKGQKSGQNIYGYMIPHTNTVLRMLYLNVVWFTFAQIPNMFPHVYCESND